MNGGHSFSFALRSAGVAFLSTTGLWGESAFSQTLRRKLASRLVNWPSVLQPNESIQTFITRFVAGSCHWPFYSGGSGPHPDVITHGIPVGTCVAPDCAALVD